MTNISYKELEYLKFSVNTAGGGGNMKELEDLIKKAKKENYSIPLKKINEFSDEDYIIGFGRLGKPTKKEFKDVEKIIHNGIIKLMEREKIKEFPKAIFPVEAVAAQFARVYKTIHSLRGKGFDIKMIDCDWCGTRAVPAIPLAVNSSEITRKFKFCITKLIKDKKKTYFKFLVIKNIDPYALEDKLRTVAAEKGITGVFINGPFLQIKYAKKLLALNAVSDSIERGRILKEKHVIGRELFEGIIIDIKEDNIPGFYQAQIFIRASNKKIYNLIARNEYIIVLDHKQKILAKAPEIINCLDINNKPIQSLFLKKGMKLRVIRIQPKFIVDHSDRKIKWEKEWKIYFYKERNKNLWNYYF